MEFEDSLGCRKLCGQDSIEISRRSPEDVNLLSLKSRLEDIGEVRGSASLLRCTLGAYELTVFPNGRAIIKGTRDLARARDIYTRYVGC
jgi:adenylyltransferase/sulfurtransferase